MSVKRVYKVGDHVSWNSEAGRMRGTVIRIHTRDFDYQGYRTVRVPRIPSTKS